MRVPSAVYRNSDIQHQHQHFFLLLCLQAFELCESLNAVGAVLDLHKLLENRKALPESKIAVLEALGDISKAAGMCYACWTSLDAARQGKAWRMLLNGKLSGFASSFFWLIDWSLG